MSVPKLDFTSGIRDDGPSHQAHGASGELAVAVGTGSGLVIRLAALCHKESKKKTNLSEGEMKRERERERWNAFDFKTPCGNE